MVENSFQFLKYICYDVANKVEKDGQNLWAHLDPFSWPGHKINGMFYVL